VVAAFPGADHSASSAPVVDSGDSVYTEIFGGSMGSSVVKVGGGGPTPIASFPTSNFDFSGETSNSGLAVDSQNNVYVALDMGNSGQTVATVPAGGSSYLVIPADIDDATGGSFGALESLAVVNGSIYGLTVNSLATSAPEAVVWTMPVGGEPVNNGVPGLVNVLATWQFPAASGDNNSFAFADGLTLSDGVLYFVTYGTVPGSDNVLTMPTSGLPTGGPLNVLCAFPGRADPELAFKGGYVYGTYLDPGSNTYQVFKEPVGGSPSDLQSFPITVGAGSASGLVNDQGTLFGIRYGNASSPPSIFSVSLASGTPVIGTVPTATAFNNETPLSGLAVDSQGNAYGMGYGGTPGVLGVYELPGLNSASPPVALPQTATATVGQPVTINVLQGDTDPQGSALTVTAVGASQGGVAGKSEQGGTLAIVADQVVYTPPANTTATQDTFVYTITDGLGLTDYNVVTVTSKTYK
jgi:hypothetical protein